MSGLPAGLPISYENVAKDIIQRSIKSAISIDNNFVEPYNDPNTGDFETPKKLIESFRKKKCSMDVYKYIDLENWNNTKDYLLSNRDLLIIDWKLVGEPPFKDTLEILWEAINLHSLSFVIIYTDDPNTAEIEMQLHSYFGTSYANDDFKFKNNYKEFFNNLEITYEEYKNDEICDDINKFFEYIAKNCKSFITKRGPLRQAEFRNFLSILKNTAKNDDYFKIFMRELISLSKTHLKIDNLQNLLESIIYYDNNCIFNTKDKKHNIIKIEELKNSYIINNTLIIILKKPESQSEISIIPELIYDKFSEYIYKKPNGIITLLSMEMKALYREKTCILGKELSDLDEIAFFQHQNNLIESKIKFNEEEFFNFLRECWNEQLFMFDNSQVVNLFNVFETYKQIPAVKEKINLYADKNNIELLQKEIIKLNNFYSFVKSMRKSDDIIRFGDIFNITVRPNEQSEVFFLCITPQCDCIRIEEKLNNKLYFVSGNRIDNDIALKNAEKGCVSFIIYEGKPMCICWKAKPFTVYINPSVNNIKNNIEIHHHDKQLLMKYIATQKETYTQRISNRSFSNASRIGITFVSLDEKVDLKPPIKVETVRMP